MQARVATAPQLRRRGRAFARGHSVSVDTALALQAQVDSPKYDIFLSQAIRDKEVVLGVYATLVQDLGLKVFCDWLEDPDNDHAATTSRDAARLREKLSASTALVFIDSDHAAASTWMSWEIGWFDAAKGRICVLPVVEEVGQDHRGREFLGLYPVAIPDEQRSFMVSVPLSKVAAGYPSGTALGIATRLPMALWASMDQLPSYFLR